MDLSDKDVKFYPFQSVIEPSFWEAFSKLKLYELKLNTDPIHINGYYSRRIKCGIPPFIYLQHDFLQPSEIRAGDVGASGRLITANTIEEFKNRDKKSLLAAEASRLWNSITSGEAEDDPRFLSLFILFIYADLKKYHYYYWFAFPTFIHEDSFKMVSPMEKLGNKLDSALVKKLEKAINDSSVELSYFCILIHHNGEVEVLSLKTYCCHLLSRRDQKYREVWLSFSDPSCSPEHPGWPLRNLLTLAAVRWKDEPLHSICALRETVISGQITIKDSLLFDVKVRPLISNAKMPDSVGWEKNERGKLGPKVCNMMNSMDPTRVAESSVDLNLRLMKWRLDPELDLEVVKKCRCLLIGAGTLGCNVARVLLGWGVNKISFVDSGRVTFSNPVRQSLFIFEDCIHEGRMKAQAAADSLKRIYPRIDSEGFVLSVPMPGHPVGESEVVKVTKDVRTLEELIDRHDALFLLTDSRESRWLPSLIGTSKGKIVLTAALGFDSFLVMRHGSFNRNDSTEEPLGCYFCNDVVAPGDSTSDRTMDQQCTVTRPGISFIAAGHIVEMLVDILQFPIRLRNDSKTCRVIHSLRYFLGRMEQLITRSPAFKNCSACSSSVVSAYQENGIDFLLKVFNSPKYLEEVSGLARLHQESEDVELLALSDDDDYE